MQGRCGGDGDRSGVRDGEGGCSKSTGKEHDRIETVGSWEVMVYDADNNVGAEGCLEEGVIHEVVEQIPNLAVAQVVTWVDLRGNGRRSCRSWEVCMVGVTKRLVGSDGTGGVFEGQSKRIQPETDGLWEVTVYDGVNDVGPNCR